KTGLSLFLGAGASADLGFPSGQTLKRDILNGCDRRTTSDLGRAISARFSEATVRRFAAGLRSSSAQSIDAFLEENNRDPELLELGRFVVWVVILGYEAKVASGGVRGSWFYNLLTRLYGDCQRSDDLFPCDCDVGVRLQVHTLNYDRVCEEVLWTWLRDKFPREKLDDRWNTIEGSMIRHSHGKLGPTRRDPYPKESNWLDLSVRFGSHLEEVSSKTPNLKFWFEPANTPETWSITNRLVELRGVHMILGFGYHQDVCRRFETPTWSDARLRKVIATCRDHSPDGATIRRAKQWLQQCYGERDWQLLSFDAGCAEAVDVLLADPKPVFP
ncbi:MAG: hypothetical protein ACO3JI_10910, partial [Steroidobacteraceae bacterium]